jgi:hypothetical protein
MRVIEEPAWSSQGWVAFAHYPSYQIYLVKDDGTGLIQFTQNSANLCPQWSADGNYLYWGYSANLGQNGKWLRNSLTNISVDTITFGNSDPQSFPVFVTKISTSNKLLTEKIIDNIWYWVHTHLDESPFNFIPITEISEFPNYANHRCWSHDSEYFYLSHYAIGEIYKVRVSDGSYELFRPQFYANWIQTIDASPDGKYLVAERVDKYNIFNPDGSIAPPTGLRHRIQLIDLETKQIKILDLD